MDRDQLDQIRASLEAMKAARDALARGRGYVSTREAVLLCPFPAGEETLLGYPPHILPRIAKNPAAKRPTYLWDPRDIQALPDVLRRWQTAITGGAEAVHRFEEERQRELDERDLTARRAA
jgi:hypothetical protein